MSMADREQVERGGSDGGEGFAPTRSLAFDPIVGPAMVVTPIVVSGRIRDPLAAAERRLSLQSWQLRQTLTATDDGRGSQAPVGAQPPR
jgi:hypothetical protein